MQWNYSPMDRDYYKRPALQTITAEKPTFPITEIGQTVAIPDPAGRFKSAAQGVQAAIRGGAGVLQMVIAQPHNTPFGGMRSIGREQRQALKEAIEVNKVKFAGVEMPTSSFTNMSGYDARSNRISEELRKSNLDEIREAIQFVAEVGGGGGVDAVAFEFDRPIFGLDPKKNPETKPGKRIFEGYPNEEKQAEIRFVDPRSGQIFGMNIGEGLFLHRDKTTFEEITFDDIQTGAKPQRWEWKDFQRFAEHNKKEGTGPTDPYELIKKERFSQNILQAEREIVRTKEQIRREQDLLERFDDIISERQEDLKNNLFYDPRSRQKIPIQTEEDRKIAEQLTAETIAEIEDKKRETQLLKDKNQELILQQEREVSKNKEIVESLQPMEDFTKRKTFDSYAEAGLMAMHETKKLGKFVGEPVFVGPEIGWPGTYGGHPQEFIEIIKGARQMMAEKLVQQGVSTADAKEAARRHIRGTFDTGHAGMWLKHFRPDLPQDQRLKEFNKWYLDQVDQIVKEDIVGSIQVVDSYGGEHAHLPPGQGILPVAEATAKFTQQKTPVHIVSEGHTEEAQGEGRIRTQAWRSLGKDLPPWFFAEGAVAPRTWGQIENGYFGKASSPRQMFGSYTPPFGEYRPWAGGDIPLGFE